MAVTDQTMLTFLLAVALGTGYLTLITLVAYLNWWWRLLLLGAGIGLVLFFGSVYLLVMFVVMP